MRDLHRHRHRPCPCLCPALPRVSPSPFLPRIPSPFCAFCRPCLLASLPSFHLPRASVAWLATTPALVAQCLGVAILSQACTEVAAADSVVAFGWIGLEGAGTRSRCDIIKANFTGSLRPRGACRVRFCRGLMSFV